MRIKSHCTLRRGRGSDFYRIRPYEFSESARHVDWKATAHTGALQVREFAREQDRAVVLCLDLDIPVGAEEWLETAIECVAFLAFELSGRGTRIHFLTQGLDVTTPDAADIYTILKHLALAGPTKGRLAVIGHETDFRIIFTQNPPNFSAFEGQHENNNVRIFSDFI